MREIKFRAWANHKKTMINMSELLNDGVLKFCLKHSNTFNIMQYTGLKDKNGKEIYEGDILYFKRKAPVNNNHSVVVVRDNMKAGFYLIPVHIYPQDRGSFRGEYIGGQPKEIIGNIYENKNLLN